MLVSAVVGGQGMLGANLAPARLGLRGVRIFAVFTPAPRGAGLTHANPDLPRAQPLFFLPAPGFRRQGAIVPRRRAGWRSLGSPLRGDRHPRAARARDDDDYMTRWFRADEQEEPCSLG